MLEGQRSQQEGTFAGQISDKMSIKVNKNRNGLERTEYLKIHEPALFLKIKE